MGTAAYSATVENVSSRISIRSAGPTPSSYTGGGGRGLPSPTPRRARVGRRMRTLLTRTFDVEAAPAAAWAHLERVERWPTWARHIKSVELAPPGPLTATSVGSLRLSNGMRPKFAMTDLVPGTRWEWVGRFLWMRVLYDHRFEPAPGGGTRITFEVKGA